MPSTARRGQYGSPNGQAAKLTDGFASGRKVYGSSQGARPFEIWSPTSQKWNEV